MEKEQRHDTSQNVPCPYCDGAGGVESPCEWDDDREPEIVPCPKCDGETTVALASCPFCGGQSVFIERADTSSAYVFCNECAARGPVGCQDDDVEELPGGSAAVTYWNRRRLPTLPDPEAGK